MTRRLAALADFSYRRRGTMVLLWIVSAVVIIALGSSLAGEYEADYNTPGSDSKAASDLTESEFGGYSGQEINVVWKDPSGAMSPAAKAEDGRLLQAGRKRSRTSRSAKRSASPTTARSPPPPCR